MWPFSTASSEPKLPPAPKKYEVGKGRITVYGKPIDGKASKWKLTYTGYVSLIGDGFTFTHSAYDLCDSWRKEGKSGTLFVGGQTYIPLVHIDRVEIKYEKFQDVARVIE